MKWYIGQPIVAIENHSTGEYKKGDEFIIESLRVGCRHSPILIGIGHSGKTSCKKCGFIADGSPYCSSSFAPLDQNISELTELLTQKQPFATMITYLAAFAFTSDNGSHYSEGQIITRAEFENLPKYEQEFFTSKLN